MLFIVINKHRLVDYVTFSGQLMAWLSICMHNSVVNSKLKKF